MSILEPAATRAVAVRTNQALRLVSSTSTNWWFQVNGGTFTQIGSSASLAIVWSTPTTVTRRTTFDDVQVIAQATQPASNATGGLLLNLCEGPVATVQVTDRIRNEALQEPFMNPDVESDDPPLGFPLAMPMANRDRMGTVLLERVYEPSGPANLVSLYGPGVFVDTNGRMGSRTPIAKLRGLGPFPAIASYHYSGFYFMYDFGHGRTLSLTRVLFADGAGNVAIVRGDGRRNTFRNVSGSFTAAAGLRNGLSLSGGLYTETTPSGTSFVYNSSSGQLQKVVDRYQNPVYYSYDSNSKLQLVAGFPNAHQSGLVAYLAYDASGHVNNLTLLGTGADNRTSYFSCDATTGLLNSIVGPELCNTYFTYASTGTVPFDYLLQRTTDSAGYSWYFAYDGNFRTAQVSDARSPAQTAYYSYDLNTPVTTWLDRAGKINYFQYNAFGAPTYAFNYNTPADYYVWDGESELILTQNRLGNVWTYQYDGSGNRISVTDPFSAKTYFGYDSTLDVLRFVTDPLGHTNYLSYDGNRNRIVQQDPVNNLTYWGYFSNGLTYFKLDRIGGFTYFGWDAAADLTSVTDPLGHTTLNGVNTAGDRTSTTDPLNRTNYFVYDKRDRLEQTQDPLGAMRYFQWDDRCDVITEIDPRGFPTYHVFDGNRNQIQTIDALGNNTYFTFDPEDRLASRTDARSNTTSWSYDVLGRRQIQTDPFSNTRYWGYDAAHETIVTLDEDKNPSYFAFDLAGRPQHQIDAFLNQTYMGYDLKGNRLLSLDKRGNPTYFTYDARDWLARTTNAIGATTYVGYDSEQDRVLTLDALNMPSYFTFDLARRLVNTKDVFLNTTYTGYDAANETVLRLDQTNAPTYFAYDLAGRQQHVTDAFQNQTYSGYDLSGNLVMSVNQRGFASYFTYDALNRQFDAIDLGEARTLNTYDPVSNRIQLDVEQGWGRQPWGTSPYGGERVTSYFTFDALNRQQTALSPQSNVDQTPSLTYTGYDPASNRLLMQTQNPKGGSDNRTTYWSYDLLNRMVTQTDPAASSGAAVGVQYFGFDPVSNRVLTIDQEGRPTYFVYDAINRQTQQFDATDFVSGALVYYDITYYDARNSVIDRIDRSGRWTYFAYDGLARLSTQSNMLGQVTYTGYDPRSSRVVTVNPRGFATYFTFDLLARLSTRTDANGGVRYFGYDPVGNQVLQTDERVPVGGSYGNPSYLTFDQANRVRVSTDALQSQTYFGYDAVGQVRMFTDADGRLTTFGYFGYDAQRRPRTMSLSTDPWIYYTYDSVGNLTTQLDQTGTSVSVFDDLNRLTTKATLGGVVYYSYDRTNRKTQLVDTNQTRTYYSYDASGRMANFTLDGGEAGYFVYDPSGLVLTKVYPNSSPLNQIIAYYTYDNAARLATLQNTNQGNAVASFVYQRDPNGNIAYFQENSLNLSGTVYYLYDALDRVTKDERRNSAGTLTYGYLYNYDAASNRYFKYDEVQNLTTYYVFDADNRMTTEVNL